MEQPRDVTGATLKTPKAAAIAGILYAGLSLVMFALLRNAVPAYPLEHGAWLAVNRDTVAFALNLVPFSGIAFIWFIGVLRDRLGAREDRFFATVFLGSGLLLLAMIFVAAGIIGALLLASSSVDPAEFAASPTFAIARATIYILINVYALKLAGVFLISTSTVIIYTRIVPRWVAYVGYALAAILLVGSAFASWNFLVLPVWVLVMSGYIAFDQFRRRVVSAS
jgi:hypothetical protein